MDAGSVVTRRVSGSIAVIVSRRKRTPGLAKSAYGQPHGRGSARPNITSSFE